MSSSSSSSSSSSTTPTGIVSSSMESKQSPSQEPKEEEGFHEVAIKTGNWDKRVLDVPMRGSDTIRMMKHRLTMMYSISFPGHFLVWSGMELDDNKTFNDYQLHKTHSVTLVRAKKSNVK